MADAPQSARGFSLIEVVLAVTILAIALLGVISAFGVSHQDVTFDSRASRAVQLAQAKVEELKSGPFPPLAGTQTTEAYTLSWSVTSVGFGAGVADLQRLAVTVTWPQPVRPGRYELAAFLSKPY